MNMKKKIKEKKLSQKKISNILKRYRKNLNKNIQRAELMSRNKMFLEESSGISKRLGKLFFVVKDIPDKELRNTLLRLDYPKVVSLLDLMEKDDTYFEDRNLNTICRGGSSDALTAGLGDRQQFSSPIKERKERKERKELKELLQSNIANMVAFLRDSPYIPENENDMFEAKCFVLQKYKNKWKQFCDRWHIKYEWNGKLRSLVKYLRNPVEISFDTKEFKSIFWLHITRWTTLEDVRAIWGKVEKLQNWLWGKGEGRTNFARDLCWYDLHKECGLKPKQIAELWAKKHPEDIDVLVVRRIRKDITGDDLHGRVLDDSELVKEIRTGSLSSEYKSYFNGERNFYLTGKIKTENKVLTASSPFVDVIKKAIKRMDTQIGGFDIPPLRGPGAPR
jgi:hypothetical protein